MTPERPNPDPLTVVEPDPVTVREEYRSGFVIVWLFAIAVIVIAVLLIVAAASRSGSQSTAPGSPYGAAVTLTGTPLPAVGDGYPSGLAGDPSNGRQSPGQRPAFQSGSVHSGGAETAGSGVPLAPVYRGTATWYCSDGRDGSRRSDCTRGYGPSDLVAAIDRKDSEFRKGDLVIVRYGDRSVTVRIVDTCRCVDARVIDLTIGAFQRLAPWGYGVIPVTLERASALPETDAAMEAEK